MPVTCNNDSGPRHMQAQQQGIRQLPLSRLGLSITTPEQGLHAPHRQTTLGHFVAPSRLSDGMIAAAVSWTIYIMHLFTGCGLYWLEPASAPCRRCRRCPRNPARSSSSYELARSPHFLPFCFFLNLDLIEIASSSPHGKVNFIAPL